MLGLKSLTWAKKLKKLIKKNSMLGLENITSSQI
jgi:hypothetical protein